MRVAPPGSPACVARARRPPPPALQELLSSDLSGRGTKVLDNVKGKWSQTLKFLGAEAKVDAEYDRKARENFLSEATISGKVDDVNYELKTGFGDTHELTLTTNTAENIALEVVADNSNGLTKVSAARDVKIQGQDVNVEVSHARQSGDSKLKFSSVLGHGVSGETTWQVGNKLTDLDTELNYEGAVNGRDLKATLNPKSGSGNVEYVDSKSIDATITASMDLGGKPSLSLKRAWNF